jgi:hypothetical protein
MIWPPSSKGSSTGRATNCTASGNDLSRLNQVENALGVERDETRWLN